MKIIKRIALGFFILFIIGVFLWGYSHLELYCSFYPDIDTIYTPAYKEKSFNQITIGMGTEEVVHLIGHPLSIIPNKDGSETWWYSRDGKCEFGDFAWIGRSLQIKEKKVERIEKKVYYD